MKKAFWLAITVIFLSGVLYPIEDARLLRHPDINGNLVVFGYAGDIWKVDAAGGNAVRLTSHKGFEMFPRISPDGKWIAFSAEYSGNRQIYIMPSHGGTPKQMTYYNDVGNMPPRGGIDYIPMDWTPDSKQILVRCHRTPYGQRKGKYFMVSLEGGLETPLQIPEAGFGTFSPDAKQVAYTPISREFRTWKRTKGGMAQDVWTYDLVNNTSRRITTFTGTDQHPIWYKNKIFFVSDRSLTLNLWSYDLDTEKLSQVTDYKEYDVLWPAGHGGKTAYENGGYIYVLNMGTGKSRKLTVNLHFDNPNRLPYFKDVSRFISNSGAGLSPDGKRGVFDARGDLFSVPAKKGVTVNLTRTQGVREMFPAWSPDGKWIAYISDETGDYELYMLDPEQKKKIVRLTHNHNIWTYQPVWSPDSKMLLFQTRDRKLNLLDIESKKRIVIDKGYWAGTGVVSYNWSGDSKWVVYIIGARNNLGVMHIYSIEKKKSYLLSSGRYNDTYADFSVDGKYIFFISDRDFNLSFGEGLSSMEFDFIMPKTSRIFAMALTKDAPPLFREENDLEKAPQVAPLKNAKPAGDKKETSTVTVDFDGIEDRISVFPMGTDDYDRLGDIGGKLVYMKDTEFRSYDLKTKSDQLIIKGVQSVVLSGNKKKFLYRQRNKYGVLGFGPNQKAGAGAFNLSDLVMKIDPVKEWRQIYAEAWRIFRDWFYVKNMHGVDWKKMKKRYAQLLPYVSHRADLDYILSELVGELNVGHAYVNWGDFERIKRMETGLLGAELVADDKAGRYKISKIYKGENWNERTRSPFTEPGVNVKKGDYIIRLNGHEVTVKDNPYKFLENTLGKKISVTVNGTPSETGARTGWFKPIRSELGLIRLEWVESRRKLVDRLSKGRIAYIYVPDTAFSGNREFFKGLYAFNDKEAFIIDDRYNGGGFFPTKMMEKLTVRPNGYWYRRNASMVNGPQYSLTGPMAMLINGYSSSGGDYFPYWFRHNKLGKLIGTRTWGGLVGYSASPQVVDGPSYGVPMSGIVDLEGNFAVEGTGVAPDEGFEVIDRPEELVKGNDPSIEAAVKHLLDQLEKHPAKEKKKPGEPDRSKWHEKMK
ncbi:MAG: acetyl-CoA synthetase [bacterium]|nr:acetyl-CoA synthetase [bacterium]